MEGYMALMIPILALSIPVIAIWTKHQQRMAEMGAAAPSARDSAALAAQAEKIRALEDRVKVLERIVTDGGYTVAAEIEALRNAPADTGTPLAVRKERV